MKTEEKIIAILENNGFLVHKDETEFWVSQYTPAGEDWNMNFNDLREIINYADDFDPEEEFAVWVEARMNGISGVPSPSILWKDQEWKREILEKVAGEVKDVL